MSNQSNTQLQRDQNWKIGLPQYSEPKEGKSPPLIVCNIIFLNSLGEFRYNVITEQSQFKPIGKEWRNIDESFINTLIVTLSSRQMTISKELCKSLFNSRYIKRYDPIEHYFDTLPPWDGNDHIQALAETVKTTDHKTWSFYLQKWLVSMVKSAYFKDTINQQMLVFYGAQGVGKTRWFMKLFPQELKELVFSGYTKLEDQMFQRKMARYMFIFMDEIDSYVGRMQALIKSFLTQEIIKGRALYSSFDDERTRIASFAAAINHEKFLPDVSGSRRFLVNEVIEIDHGHNVPMDKVFAHAFALARDPNFRHYFNADEIKELEQRNDRFKVKSDAEVLILQYYEPCTDNAVGARYLSSTRILANIQEKSGLKIKSNANAIGVLMKQLGFLRGSVGTGNEKRAAWLVLEKD